MPSDLNQQTSAGGTERPGSTDTPVKSASDTLFDLRMVIGVVFLVYGVVLAAYSFTDSTTDLQKADGIRINLWTGLGMLVIGVVFVLWQRLRPISHDEVAAATQDEEEASS